MKTNSFFPNHLKVIAWIVFIPSIILGAMAVFENKSVAEPSFFDVELYNFRPENLMNDDPVFKWIKNNLFNELLGFLIILSGLILGFSKVKMEDEFIAQVRARSLIWATYINYGILLFSIIFIYDLSFYPIMIFGMFTSLILFVLHFHWQLFQLSKKMKDEK